MRKVLIIITLFYTKCFSQDTLSKYSFDLLKSKQFEDTSIHVSPTTFGTGFFITHNNISYLVTASHFGIGCDSCYNGLIDSSPIFVGVNNKGAHLTGAFYVRQNQLTTERKCYPNYVKPDISIFKRNRADSINAINGMLSNRLPDVVSELVVFGNPVPSIEFFQNRDYYRIHSRDFKIFESVNVVDACSNKQFFDSINYRMVFNDYKLPTDLHGFSGAPVFVKDAKSSYWFFLGVLIGGDKNTNSIIVVKYKYVLQLLKI